MNRYLAIAHRHLRPLLGLNLLWIGGLACAIYVRPIHWQARTKLIVPSTTGALDVSLGQLGQFRSSPLEVSSQLNLLDTLSAVLLSDDTLTQLLQQDIERDRFETVDDYRKLFTLSKQGGTTILRLEASANKSTTAENRLNQLLILFDERLAQLRRGESADRAAFAQEELVAAKARLQEAQDRLSAFKTASGLVSSDAQTRSLVEAVARLRSRHSEVTAARLSSQAQMQLFQERLGLTSAAAVQSLALSEDETFQFLRQEIVRLDARLAQLSSLYQDGHPQLLLLQSERAKLQAQVENQITTQISFANPRVEAGPLWGDLMRQLVLSEVAFTAHSQEAQVLQNQMVQLDQQIKALPDLQAQLAELEREYDVAEGIHNGLTAKVAEAGLDVFSVYPNVQILDQPRVKTQPIRPKLHLMLMGTLFAMGFSSLALMLWLEGRNPLLTPADVFAADLPVLGTTPLLNRHVQQLQGMEPPDLAFQRLALGIAALELSRRRILISSAASREGKTTVTIGLAQALVALGFRVLLVDGNFYQACLTQSLRCKQAMESERPAEMLGAPIALAPNLDLMPTEPCQSHRTMEFVVQGDFDSALALAERAGQYDYLLVDSAPVEFASEIPLMGAVTENVLFVTRAGFSERDQVYRALEEFSRHSVNLLGLLINDATSSHAPKAAQLYRQKSWSGAG